MTGGTINAEQIAVQKGAGHQDSILSEPGAGAEGFAGGAG